MIIVPDTSSDDNNDDCWCQSCTSDINDMNSRQLWDDLSHIIKCVYRATDKEFSGLRFKNNVVFLFNYFSFLENQFSDDISKAKEYVKK